MKLHKVAQTPADIGILMKVHTQYGRERDIFGNGGGDYSNAHHPHAGHHDSAVHANTTSMYGQEIPHPPLGGTTRRTIFLRVPPASGLKGVEVRAHFSTFGDLADVYDLIKLRGMCYVTFYDSRSTRRAIEECGDWTDINGTSVGVIPSSYRPNVYGRHPSQNDNQATILVCLKGAKKALQSDDQAFFGRFGEVSGFYPFHGQHFEWVVEFCDTRAVKRVFSACDSKPYNDGTMHLTLLWDDSVTRAGPVPDDHAQGARGRSYVDRDRDSDFGREQYHPGPGPHRHRRQEEYADIAHDYGFADANKDQAPLSSNQSASYPEAGKRAMAASWMSTADSYNTNASTSANANADANANTGAGADADADADADANTRSPFNAGSTATMAPTSASTKNPKFAALSKLAANPDIMRKAQAAREILQQHQHLLGIAIPPLATGPAPTAVPPVSSAITAFTSMEERSPEGRSQALAGSISGQAAASTNGGEMVAAIALATRGNDQSGRTDSQPRALSSALLAESPAPAQLQPQPQPQPQAASISTAASATSQDDGISKLLGILAAVQRSASAKR
ncbi:hypothetical protein GGI12_000413 [Dipsacomyces acuminosporus]|nr:hypothetical protein GGI12_000413 [Dipsacomyces acuminosporus]